MSAMDAEAIRNTVRVLIDEWLGTHPDRHAFVVGCVRAYGGDGPALAAALALALEAQFGGAGYAFARAMADGLPDARRPHSR